MSGLQMCGEMKEGQALHSKSKRGHVRFVDLEFDGDLLELPTHSDHFVQLWIKVVFEHGGPRAFEKEIRMTPDGTYHPITRHTPG